jgi:hypothetical protein
LTSHLIWVESRVTKSHQDKKAHPHDPGKLHKDDNAPGGLAILATPAPQYTTGVSVPEVFLQILQHGLPSRYTYEHPAPNIFQRESAL